MAKKTKGKIQDDFSQNLYPNNDAWNNKPVLDEYGNKYYPQYTPVSGMELIPASEKTPNIQTISNKNVIGSQANTWENFTKTAQKVADQEGFPLGVLLGQAAIETGRSPYNAPGNNWFGIKGYGNAGSQNLATSENYNGQNVNINDQFGAYRSMEDNIKAYINLIKSWPEVWALKDNPVQMIQAIKNRGYATDPDYVSKVANTPEFKTLASASPSPTPSPYVYKGLLKDENKANFNPFSLFTPTVQAEENKMNPVTQTKTQNNSYTVKKGDTLWGIAQQLLGSGNRWGEITGYTGKPEQLPVGQKLNIPTKSPYVAPMTPANQMPIATSRTGQTMYTPYTPPQAPRSPTPQPNPTPTQSQPKAQPFNVSNPSTYMTPRNQPVPVPTPYNSQPFPVATMSNGKTRYSDGSIR